MNHCFLDIIFNPGPLYIINNHQVFKGELITQIIKNKLFLDSLLEEHARHYSK